MGCSVCGRAKFGCNNEYLISRENEDMIIKVSKSVIRTSLDCDNSVNGNQFKNEINDSEKVKSNKAHNSKDFKTLIFENINKARKNPKKFSELIESVINLIKFDKERKKYYFDKSDDIDDRIYLKKGIKTFYDAVISFKGAYPIYEFLYKDDLEIPLDENEEHWTKRQNLTNALEKKTNELEKIYSGFSFHFDVNVRNPELSIILQVVDDGNFYGQRKNNLLSHELKFVGITHSDLNNKDRSCIYFNFAF